MKNFTFIFCAMVMLSLSVNAQIETGTGLYEFADPEDLWLNTATGSGEGNIECEGVFKFDSTATDGSFDDMESVLDEDYSVISGISDSAISLKAHNWFKIWHGIAANGGGDYVNDFTVLIDVRISDTSKVYSLLEVNPTPSTNGYTSELEIVGGKVGSVGAPASGEDAFGFSETILDVDQWYRIVYVGELGSSIKAYVDGTLVNSIEGDFLDARPAPYGADTDPDDAAFKVGGNNEKYPANDPARDYDKDIDLVAVFGSALTDAEVAALGAPESGTTSIKNVMNGLQEFRLYPNPASNLVTVELKGNARVEIINISGMVVKRAEAFNSTTRLDLSNLSKGLYFVNVINDKGLRSSQKLLLK